MIGSNLAPRMDIDILHPFYREFARAYEETTDAPMEFLISSLLPSIGAAISTNRWIQWGSKRIYPNIWIMLVGQSTILRKSTSLDIGTSALRSLNAEKPDRHFILPNDGSFAGFLECLKVEKNGVLKHSEVASLLENMNKGYNLSMKSLFTDFFDVPPFHKIYIKETGEEHIKTPMFGIAAGTTLNWLKQNISRNDRESGFLARFLYCYMDNKEKSMPIPKMVDPRFSSRFKEVFLRLMKVDPFEIIVDRSYQESYIKFYECIDRSLRNPLLDDGTKSLLGRLQTDYFLKLTILDSTLSGRSLATSDVADRVSAMLSFYVNQALNIMNMLLKTDIAKTQEKILEYLDKRKRVSATDIHRLFNNHLHSKNLHATMKGLEDAGLIRKVTKEKGVHYELLQYSPE